MAQFGDATAHAAILGVALSLAMSISVFAGARIVPLLIALTVSLLSGRGYAMDTLLGVVANSALAFGFVAISFLSGIRIDHMAYLFGDILAVSRSDLAVLWGGALVVIMLMSWRWSALLTLTLNADLALASGIGRRRHRLSIERRRLAHCMATEYTCEPINCLYRSGDFLLYIDYWYEETGER